MKILSKPEFADLKNWSKDQFYILEEESTEMGQLERRAFHLYKASTEKEAEAFLIIIKKITALICNVGHELARVSYQRNEKEIYQKLEELNQKFKSIYNDCRQDENLNAEMKDLCQRYAQLGIESVPSQLEPTQR